MEVMERPKFCPECGVAVKPAGRFCGGCGKEIPVPVPNGNPVPVPVPVPTSEAQAKPSTVDPTVVLAGGWLAMTSPRLRASKGAKPAMLLAAATGCATLAAFVWWFDYAIDRASVDTSILLPIAIGSLSAIALGAFANARLARDSSEAIPSGAAKVLAAVPLAVALLSLAMTPSLGREIEDARLARRRLLEGSSRSIGGAYPPRPSSKPLVADPTFPVPGR